MISATKIILRTLIMISDQNDYHPPFPHCSFKRKPLPSASAPPMAAGGHQLLPFGCCTMPHHHQLQLHHQLLAPSAGSGNAGTALNLNFGQFMPPGSAAAAAAAAALLGCWPHAFASADGTVAHIFDPQMPMPMPPFVGSTAAATAEMVVDQCQQIHQQQQQQMLQQQQQLMMVNKFGGEEMPMLASREEKEEREREVQPQRLGQEEQQQKQQQQQQQGVG